MIDILCAVLLDLILGDPPSFPHPIKLMGKLIAAEETLIRRYAKDSRALLFGGLLLVIANLVITFSVPSVLLTLLRPYPYIYHAFNMYLLYTCLAGRCLRDEVINVYKALERGIEEARYRLSFIVGRETTRLDEPQIIRATVETVAENSSDGVIAPLFYAMIGGAPLALVYKMVNTMDSMLGYMNAKYKKLGFFPAKIDDVFNIIPARLTGMFMIMGSLFPNFNTPLLPFKGGIRRKFLIAYSPLEGRQKGVIFPHIGTFSWFHILDGFKIMIRDRNNHKSPNCAYPEGAMAGLLGVQLGGHNVYFGQTVSKPSIGDRKRALERNDIPRSVAIMFRAEIVCILSYIVLR